MRSRLSERNLSRVIHKNFFLFIRQQIFRQTVDNGYHLYFDRKSKKREQRESASSSKQTKQAIWVERSFFLYKLKGLFFSEQPFHS